MNAFHILKIEELSNSVFEHNEYQIGVRKRDGNHQFNFGLNPLLWKVISWFFFYPCETDLVKLGIMDLISGMSLALEPDLKFFPSYVLWVHVIQSLFNFL